MADGSGVVSGVYAGTGVGGFRRASNATYVDASGVLQTVGNDILRSGYDPITLNSIGLILEGASTNSIRNPRGEGAVAGPGQDDAAAGAGLERVPHARQLGHHRPRQGVAARLIVDRHDHDVPPVLPNPKLHR